MTDLLSAAGPIGVEGRSDIVLDAILPADRERFVAHLADPRVAIHTMNIPFPYTLDDADWWIAEVARREAAAGERSQYAIRLDSGELIGSAGFHLDRDTFSDVLEVGFWIAQPFWGRGMMTAVLATLCRLAFDAHGARRVFGQVFAPNVGSMRVFEKCGFRREGVLRQHARRGDDLHDLVVYGLLKSEWRAPRGTP